jgi:hypothetical protein
MTGHRQNPPNDKVIVLEHGRPEEKPSAYIVIVLEHGREQTKPT